MLECVCEQGHGLPGKSDSDRRATRANGHALRNACRSRAWNPESVGKEWIRPERARAPEAYPGRSAMSPERPRARSGPSVVAPAAMKRLRFISSLGAISCAERQMSRATRSLVPCLCGHLGVILTLRANRIDLASVSVSTRVESLTNEYRRGTQKTMNS